MGKERHSRGKQGQTEKSQGMGRGSREAVGRDDSETQMRGSPSLDKRWLFLSDWNVI